MEIRHPLLVNGGADADAELAFPVETQIAVTAGVRTAREGFQFVNDLHRTEFWRAGDAAAWKTGRQRNEMRRRRTQTAFDRRNEMLHLGKAFEPHQFRHVHAAEFANLA